MHHLPPQIRALMGRQIAVRGGHAGRPVPAPPACLPGGTRLCVPGCARRVWMDIRLCQWMGTEQERVLVCMRGCQRSVLQESADVQAHMHMRGGRLSLELAPLSLFEGAQRKGCCTLPAPDPRKETGAPPPEVPAPPLHGSPDTPCRKSSYPEVTRPPGSQSQRVGVTSRQRMSHLVLNHPSSSSRDQWADRSPACCFLSKFLTHGFVGYSNKDLF
ncbi:uncharacterized protein LOC131824294 [Mustela lutreola]|uniref:uncharacterized protein LOC131824294 n=1 Tax=Mustela lutreola TaxID=9666 RepID=UPI002796FC2A|nr:uncharacterized protein LOC131824294 [Mustela lutreola]